jgi:hypothetical protein
MAHDAHACGFAIAKLISVAETDVNVHLSQ